MNQGKIIFIVSQPRSGSTLLQTILARSKQIATTGESWLLLPFLSLLRPDAIKADYDHALAWKGIRNLAESTGGIQRIKKLIAEFVQKVYEPLLNGTEDYFLDKTPRYYEILQSITEILPEARIIILRRNPLAVLSSIIDTWEVRKPFDLYFYRNDILKAPLLINDFLNDQINNRNVTEIHYEKLVQQPEGEVARIMEWLALPFDKKMLQYDSKDLIAGSLGDKKEIHKHYEVVSHLQDRWLAKLDESKWRSFFTGYANYLGKEILDAYDLPAGIYKKSILFTLFQDFCKHQIPEVVSKPGFFKWIRLKLAYHFY